MYLAAVLEYLAAEFLDLAGNMARDNNKTLIDSRQLQHAVCKDEELMKLIRSVTIASGDMSFLLPLLPPLWTMLDAIFYLFMVRNFYVVWIL